MRPYQIVVWGGTGFTGRLVCEHIATDYQGKVRWAVAGRSQEKLDALKADLVKINPSCKDVPLLLADAYDQPSVDKVANETDVLLTTAGPYAKYGLPVVKVGFVRTSMRDYDAIAKASNAKILHSCGYDSIPTDLTTLLNVDLALEKFGRPPSEVTLLQEAFGGVSGGTIESALDILSKGGGDAVDPSAPYCLDPPDSLYASGTGPDKPVALSPVWSEAAKTWTAPYVMAIANEPVARRTNALLGYLYGEKFSIMERTAGFGLPGAVAMSALNAGIGATMFAASKVPFIRSALPAAGSGPSKLIQTSGYWKATSYGLIKARDGQPEERTRIVLQDPKRDPGYWSTSRMILEAALCLALNQDALARDKYAQQCPAGVLTPASALGLVLCDRLTAAGYKLEKEVL